MVEFAARMASGDWSGVSALGFCWTASTVSVPQRSPGCRWR
jgi:hypothetical protein